MAQRSFTRAASDAPKSAANYIHRSATAIRSGDAGVSRRHAEQQALIQWAERHSRLVGSEVLNGFDYKGSGAEHLVYYDEVRNQAIKVTHPNRFGHSTVGPGIPATALEYLLRLAWCNGILGDEYRIVGVLQNSDDVQVISSQPWICAHNDPHPDRSEIDGYFGQFKFFPGWDNPDAPLYYNEKSNLVILDGHDHNVIRDFEGKIVAIDVVIGLPGKQVKVDIDKFLARNRSV